MEIFAAGAVCWREVGKDLMVAIIHRGRYHATKTGVSLREKLILERH